MLKTKHLYRNNHLKTLSFFNIYLSRNISALSKSFVRTIDFISSLADLPTHTAEEKQQRRFLIYMGIFMSCGGILWGSIAAMSDLVLRSLIPFGYTAITILNYSVLYFTKNFKVARLIQVMISLLLPFLFQWSLGGFISSGSMMTWAILAVLGSFTFQERKSTMIWFMCYLILAVLSGFMDHRLQETVNVVPSSVNALFFTINVAVISTIIFSLAYYFVASDENLKKLLAEERNKAENLLLNILPRNIADRLKSNPEIIADRFSNVTILFLDIVDFTKYSQAITPQQLVKELNQIFSIFDRLVDQFHVEKIKTIGDAYMVASGLPVHKTDHVESAANLALEMLSQIDLYNRKNNQNFKIRIGIHNGPVVAGVIGTKKFVYDVWGDTVNIASRMQSHGVPGKIQVSQQTFMLLKDKYQFEERGMIEIKGKDAMPVYLLEKALPYLKAKKHSGYTRLELVN